MNRKTCRLPVAALAVALGVAAGDRAIAEVRLPAVIGDNMVLQQGVEIPIWGWAKPKERVSVQLTVRPGVRGAEKQACRTKAGADGTWMVTLKPLAAGGPIEMKIAGRNKISITNVMVGEVWFCSGQSNMQMALDDVRGGSNEVAAANYPAIRILDEINDESGEKKDWPIVFSQPQSDVACRWKVCTPAAARRFSAAAYFFGRDMHRDRQVAVGLIHASLGGSMVAPIRLFPVRGVIWYEGESNVARACQYRVQFRNMILAWRKAWGHEIPFLYVQLPGFHTQPPAAPDEPPPGAWAELREAQLMALTLPKTAMVETLDIGDPDSIHLLNKQEVGRRLYLAAKAVAYGWTAEYAEYSGPIYESMNVEGDKVRLLFTHMGGGLTAKPDSPAGSGQGELAGFVVAGEDQQFLPARARVEGLSVVVWSEQVVKPVAVRYAWADAPEFSLFNLAGFPASPFRTDDWPGVTVEGMGR